MKIKKLELGVELIPENDYERECLKHIANKQVVVKFEDSWDQSGNLSIKFSPHPWD